MRRIANVLPGRTTILQVLLVANFVGFRNQLPELPIELKWMGEPKHMHMIPRRVAVHVLEARASTRRASTR